MINRQANILFIPTSIGAKSAEPQDPLSQRGHYERLIYASLARSIDTVEGFQILGKQLAALARHAYVARQMDAVEQASQMMLVLPISDQFRSIARYYQALSIRHQGDFDGARRSLEQAAEQAPPQYRARALHAIGLTHHERGEVDAALPFYLAAGKAAANCDLLTLAESQKAIATVRSMHGDHKQALADLEGLFPLIRAIGKYYPAAYYNFLNSLAVELTEVGRIGEAEAALSIALVSPFAPAYPGWSETAMRLQPSGPLPRPRSSQSIARLKRFSYLIPHLSVSQSRLPISPSVALPVKILFFKELQARLPSQR